MLSFLKIVHQNRTKNRSVLALLPIIGLPFLCGCTAKATAWSEKIAFSQPSMPTQCGGWQKLEIKNSTRYYLLEKDQRLLVDLDAHNLRGKQIGCWQ
ncbi:hypothetical protein N5853_00185 [Bartonella sp. HY329]|uniref:hypothetical protein n=1 Tax=unclassified Bartonella TaxID=2645622 RepID=UPI0021CA1B95|nr:MULTISPECIES: hypothetical protein [unclassified Bartonella]UXM95120.1 hypothetical protein N5853_00185 [Bartonella sp. HY329]UXN09443.1 hypothetical protein N5852_00190 [Bartonella sp. HY328]